MNPSQPAQDFDERIVPDQTEKGIISIHLKRYEFARPFCAGKTVLDAACGVGYGTHDLAAGAAKVYGIDLSADAISYASGRYAKSNTVFQTMNICRLDFQNDFFDTVVSFETLEHLDRPLDCLKEVMRVLKPEGVYLVSVPYTKESTNTPLNPHHYQEWSPEDFERMLSSYFSSVQLFGQLRKQSALHRLLQKADIWNLHTRWKSTFWTKQLSRSVGTTPFTDMTLKDMVISEHMFHNALSVIGFCRGPKKLEAPK